jgi:uncharacterized protein with HEPN domain
MRPERLYLEDIVEAIEAIQRFLGGKTEDDFLSDELLQSAVLHKLTVIGEASARLPKEFKDLHPEIEWYSIVAFRNIAIHAYFSVEWSIVWVASTEDAAALKAQIEPLLRDIS